jgi:hypothetical protein
MKFINLLPRRVVIETLYEPNKVLHDLPPNLDSAFEYTPFQFKKKVEGVQLCFRLRKELSSYPPQEGTMYIVDETTLHFNPDRLDLAAPHQPRISGFEIFCSMLEVNP